MDRSEVVELIVQTYIEDEIGQQIPQETSREVFCNISSVSSNEYFEAAQSGLTAEYRITIFNHDYKNEKIVVLNKERYAVYRTYLGPGEMIELYLQKKVGI